MLIIRHSPLKDRQASLSKPWINDSIFFFSHAFAKADPLQTDHEVTSPFIAPRRRVAPSTRSHRSALAGAASFLAAIAFAASPLRAAPNATLISATSQTDTLHGLFNWLDDRSQYGQDAFPEPFIVDDSALETNESRLDWLHTSANNQRSDLATAEVEKGFGLLTLEVELHFERDTSLEQSADAALQGIGNVDLGARYPLYQFVSGGGQLDITFGAAAEIGVPTNSPVSKNAEIVPKLFADLKLGDYLTIQSIFGYSVLYGGGDEGGLHTFEYGFVFGYTIPHDELALPYVLQFIPVFELSGVTQLNKDDPGHNSLLGNLGFRLNLKAIGRVQPRLGIGYVFSIDKGARADLRRGIITSFVFEY